VILASMLSASGCANTAVLELCPSWVSPLTWSDRDTEETQREIFAHNLKYEQFCLQSGETAD
jgi:hypothetical protein